jgi:hypothetical protein
MNEQLCPTSLPFTAQAAEGLVRRRFTVAEVASMAAKGILAEDERIELIGGELALMWPKESATRRSAPSWRSICRAWRRKRSGWCRKPSSISPTMLAYDLNTKAGLYPGYGVREYWVISARTLATRVHFVPSAASYSTVAELPAGARLTPQAAPELAVSLGEISISIERAAERGQPFALAFGTMHGGRGV